jgi:hypothetical protein
VIEFLHWTGWALWLGAQLTFMVWGPAAKRVPLESWAHTWDTLSKVQRWIVAPSCAATTISGVILAMQYPTHDYPAGTPMAWLYVMAGLGVVAAALTIVVATPLVNRMAFLAAKSLEAGQLDARAEPVRRKLAWAGSVSGVLILVAVYASVVKF